MSEQMKELLASVAQDCAGTGTYEFTLAVLERRLLSLLLAGQDCATFGSPECMAAWDVALAAAKERQP
jgi:hypothetical protein